jgi:hypothetical protein
MFNIIIFIIINIIINKFEKKIITIEKNHKFDLKDKIKNYYYYYNQTHDAWAWYNVHKSNF